MPDTAEFVYLRWSIVAVGVIAVIVVAAWKAHDAIYPPPTRLERTVFCLKDHHDLVAVVPAGDPISNTARAGSFRVTVEGSEVVVSLAKSESEAAMIEQSYRAVGGNLEGRLERRGRSVFLWQGVATPTQRQTMYDCEY
jgi:hypothetical protein